MNKLSTFAARRLNHLPKHLCLPAILAFLLVLFWQDILSSPGPPPKIHREVFDYADLFALRDQYSSRFNVYRHAIEKGDSFYGILDSLDLPAGLSLQWARQCPELSQLNQLLPGEEIAIQVYRESGQPFKIRYQCADGSTHIYRNRGNGWEHRTQRAATIQLARTAAGSIHHNLYDSCVEAGLPADLVMELADLFAYDIDFNTDIRDGDRFAVRFNQAVQEGRRVHAGPILAAEMTVDGHSYQAFYYELPDGYRDYFDSEGRSLRKLFLKAPLSYRRISSTFTYRRYHPILKIYRPHLGIDYAAPTGTPVSALGDGKVIFKGRKGGFGKYIVLSHGSHYKTTYGHLSRYAKGLRVGSRVRQGDVIGYVGSTGLATGPHLDFRFYKNGKPINFLKTRFPHARSVPKKLLAHFNATKQRYLAQLEKPTLVTYP